MLPCGMSFRVGVGKFIVVNYNKNYQLVAGIYERASRGYGFYWSGWTGYAFAQGDGIFLIFMDSHKHGWWYNYDGRVKFSECGIT